LDRRIRFDIAREFFNIFLTEDIEFNCIILDKEKLNFKNILITIYIKFIEILLLPC